MRIQYHLSPIELIEIFEPKLPIEGCSEEEIKEAEERLHIRIPAVYREYMLKCGKCSLNQDPNYMYTPKKLYLTYDENREYRDSDYDPDDPDWAVDGWFINGEHKTMINPFGVVFQHPEEEWGQFVKNYLMIWLENQGVWEAGICVDDFDKEYIPVSFPVDSYGYKWQEVYPSIQSFLSWMIYNSIECLESQLLSDETKIQEFFDEKQIDINKLTPNPPPFADENLSTFLLPDENIAGFYLHDLSDEPSSLHIFDISVDI